MKKPNSFYWQKSVSIVVKKKWLQGFVRILYKQATFALAQTLLWTFEYALTIPNQWECEK
jgi:hypothetical protein